MLIVCFLGGKVSQEEEFLQAFEAYAEPLFRHCVFRISDRERARDLVQDTFTKTWDYLVSGRKVHSFKPFLYRTINNLIVDEYRKRKNISLESLFEEGNVKAEVFEELQDHSFEDLGTKLDAREIPALLEELPEAYRQVLVMRFVDELSPKEVAEALEISQNAVSVRIHRGLLKLRELYERKHGKNHG
ncbi:MAG: RNA polymerase sigma factor [Candidatus Paceibacterota bacterium]